MMASRPAAAAAVQQRAVPTWAPAVRPRLWPTAVRLGAPVQVRVRPGRAAPLRRSKVLPPPNKPSSKVMPRGRPRSAPLHSNSKARPRRRLIPKPPLQRSHLVGRDLVGEVAAETVAVEEVVEAEEGATSNVACRTSCSLTHSL